MTIKRSSSLSTSSVASTDPGVVCSLSLKTKARIRSPARNGSTLLAAKLAIKGPAQSMARSAGLARSSIVCQRKMRQQ